MLSCDVMGRHMNRRKAYCTQHSSTVSMHNKKLLIHVFFIIFPVFLHILKKNVFVLWLYLQDDPDAHANFLRVNRAYEVLKDEDLRKKYDMYGEDGLKEGGPTGHSYQSWSFYNQDFGMS